jgi:hypothetical protein
MNLLKSVLALTILSSTIASAAAKPFDHNFAAWDALEKKHVHWLPDHAQSRVNYTGFKQDKVQFDQVLADLSAVTQAEFDQWTANQQKAFLINAYNAFTISLILSKYPDLKSIKDLGSVFKSPWKKAFFQLLGEERYLDWIENDNLRPRYKDPRIHVGIVCASIGCPALRPEAITAAKIDAQLDDSLEHFMSDKTRNRVVNGKLEVSPIFKWFSADFEKGHKGFSNPLDVFAKYAKNLTPDPATQEKIRSKSLSVTYSDYDWNLNDSKR